MTPASINLLKRSNGNTRTMREISSKLTINTPGYLHVSETIGRRKIHQVNFSVNLYCINDGLTNKWVFPWVFMVE